MKPSDIIKKLIKEAGSCRAFAREIDEDVSDVFRWKSEKLKIKARAIVKICRLYPDITPHDLRPDWYDKDVRFIFGVK